MKILFIAMSIIGFFVVGIFLIGFFKALYSDLKDIFFENLVVDGFKALYIVIGILILTIVLA